MAKAADIITSVFRINVFFRLCNRLNVERRGQASITDGGPIRVGRFVFVPRFARLISTAAFAKVRPAPPIATALAPMFLIRNPRRATAARNTAAPLAMRSAKSNDLPTAPPSSIVTTLLPDALTPVEPAAVWIFW